MGVIIRKITYLKGGRARVNLPISVLYELGSPVYVEVRVDNGRIVLTPLFAGEKDERTTGR